MDVLGSPIPKQGRPGEGDSLGPESDTVCGTVMDLKRITREEEYVITKRKVRVCTGRTLGRKFRSDSYPKFNLGSRVKYVINC